jgi:phospholipid-binding lipoprotein MlaA
MRTGIRNFFSNLREITTLANSMLQLKAKKTGGTAARFVVNTTIGVAGLWDPASRVGLRGYDEDFGQTLGYWGVPAGAYFVIPLLGPSSVRDAFGSAVDRVPFFLVGFPSLWLLPVQTLDARANNPFRYGDLGGAFEYGIVRFLATERRKLLIAD